LSDDEHQADELLTISRADLYAVYEYARHFDVDDDPAMIRVRAALDKGGSSETGE
jgi:hypothetical protein